MGKKGKTPVETPLFEANENDAEKVFTLAIVNRSADMKAGVGRSLWEWHDVVHPTDLVFVQEASSAGNHLPSSAMGKAFSHTDKKVRDKAVAVFSKWISRQANLSEEVGTSLADHASLRLFSNSPTCSC